MDLVWRKDVQHGGPHIIEVECAYIPHAQVSKFINGEWSHEDSLIEWNIYKSIPPQENVKMPRIHSHIWYDALLFTLIIWLIFILIFYWTLGPKLIAHFEGMHVGMDQKTIADTQTAINPLNKII
jgi:hypothetical protein